MNIILLNLRDKIKVKTKRKYNEYIYMNKETDSDYESVIYLCDAVATKQIELQ